jgi:putative ABC transport system permease protein
VQAGTDLRYAVRGLRRSPGVAVVILLTLALGIGVNTAIFSFVDAILLKPLPYPNADRIVGIWERRPSGQPNSMTTLNYLDYARQSTTFELMAATTGCCGLTILNGEPPVSLFTLRVSPQYFDVFDATAALGRTFAVGDDAPGRNRVIVLSHRAWASHFGSDPAIVGKAIRINNEAHTVIGVMPEHGPFDRMVIEAWLPLTFSSERMNRTSHWLIWLTGGAIGRLKPGVTIEQARADLDAVGARLSAEYPDTNKGWSAVVQPYASIVAGRDLQRSLYALLAAVGVVLLIGCVNVAGVMLARALAREREIEVRIALGASHARVVQLLLTESLVTSLGGGALGVAIGYLTIWFLKAALAALPLNLAILPVLIPAEASIRRAGLLGSFAALAVALAAIGIFGVISYSVVQRTQEIGIRSALGATPARLVWFVLGDGLAWIALGLATGALASLGTTRLLASVLFGVGPRDPFTLTATLAFLAGVAVLACYVPARHAARLDPLEALRTD